MTAPIRTCPDHGPFSADRNGDSDEEEDREDAGTDCPVCGDRGASLLSGERRRRLSKFMSGALRHFPTDVGLELDEYGWTPYGDLVVAVERKYDWARPEHMDAVIATDPNGRFERSSFDEDATTTTTAPGDHVRAAYGHSVDVELEPTDAPIPDELYHGTAPENRPSIREDGLQPMSRQQVHLSGSREEARRVGRRHASEPAVLVVDAAAMLADGHRITKRGRETYTTDTVPPSYLDCIDDAV